MSGRSRVVGRTQDFALGVHDDIVVIVLFAGPGDEPRHVTDTADLLKAEHDRLGRPMRMLALIQGSRRPPSARVREAFQRTIPRFSGLVSKVAVVVLGEGFEAAIHRAAATGLRLLVRSKIDASVHATLSDALPRLLAPNEPREPLIQFCERELAEG